MIGDHGHLGWLRGGCTGTERSVPQEDGIAFHWTEPHRPTVLTVVLAVPNPGTMEDLFRQFRAKSSAKAMGLDRVRPGKNREEGKVLTPGD